jgi:hypothetical protein
MWRCAVTTFEPVGFRAKRTGALVVDLEPIRAFGVRGKRGRRMKDPEWQEYVEAHYEVVYRIVPVGGSCETCEACAKTGNGLACEDHFYC